MAAAKPGVWGIDLGQCGLKALRLEVIDDRITATAFDYVEHPKILSQPDADPDQLTRAALDQFLSRNSVKGDLIAVSVPGQTGLARFVKLPPVEAKKIPDIVKFEAKQQIPFPLEEVVWDWQTIKANSIAEGFVENEIGLFAMKRDMVSRALQAFKDVKIEVHFIQMTPLALCNYAVFDELGKGGPGGESFENASKQAVVVVDMGADSTNMVITDGDRVIWQRPIPIGGNHFTRALTKEMKLTFAKAEHVKRNASKAEDPRKIFQAMKPVFTDFVGELQRSLGFFTNSHREVKVQRLVGMGNGFRLPGLQKFINQALNIEVDKLTDFKRLAGDDVVKAPVFRDNVMTFSVAYGLALQGLAAAKLTTNLLPQEIHRERVIRAKKPWLAASAAALLVGVTLSAFPLGNLSKAAEESENTANQVSDPAAKRVASVKGAFDNADRDRKSAVDQAKNIARGGKERLNWAMLHLFVNQCVPQPNGDNLSPAAYAKYWKHPQSDAKAAWDAMVARHQRGERRDAKDLRISSLTQVNIQGVYARYCDDPKAAKTVLEAIRSDTLVPQPHMQPFKIDPDWESGPASSQGGMTLKNTPKDPGWFIEIHGFTSHEGPFEERGDKLPLGGFKFILDTLVANLRDKEKHRFSLPKDAEALEGFIRDLRQTGPADASALKHIDVSHVVVYRQRAKWIIPGQQEAGSGFEVINKDIHIRTALESAFTGGAQPGPDPTFPGPVESKPAATASSSGSTGRTWNGMRYLFEGGSQGTQTGPPTATTGGEKPVDPSAKPIAKPSHADARLRTEFVIVFYWVERRPTDISTPTTGGQFDAPPFRQP
jgi:type IV pilus assembly protein PilM